MRNIDVDDLAQIIREVDGNHDLGAGELAEAILDRLPAPQTIRTVEELEALDPDTVVCIDREFATFQYTDCTVALELPAVVIRDGEQVRAARKALNKETNND